jgi:hypothetical protein
MTENGIKPKDQTTASLWNRSTSGLVEESAVKLNYFGVSDKVLLSAGHARARWITIYILHMLLAITL